MFPTHYWSQFFDRDHGVSHAESFLGDVSRTCAKVLRHSADRYYPRVEVDDYGFAPVDQLLARINAEQHRVNLRDNITADDLVTVVGASAGRFQLFGYVERDLVMVRMRATQGHSMTWVNLLKLDVDRLQPAEVADLDRDVGAWHQVRTLGEDFRHKIRRLKAWRRRR